VADLNKEKKEPSRAMSSVNLENPKSLYMNMATMLMGGGKSFKMPGMGNTLN
jgi:hypothetical protein